MEHVEYLASWCVGADVERSAIDVPVDPSADFDQVARIGSCGVLTMRRRILAIDLDHADLGRRWRGWRRRGFAATRHPRPSQGGYGCDCSGRPIPSLRSAGAFHKDLPI